MPRDRDPLVFGRVVGDVLDSFTRSIALRVIYGNREVNNRCKFRPPHIVNQPRVEIGGDGLRTFYTLVMMDPNAPSPSDPNLREYLHSCSGMPRNFNTRDFAELYNLGLPVAAVYFKG
ncbi:hypothetical protein ACH5RR_018585 [Cinchona calisaya]|uniref:Uncharacterized protein n=1 Tax=Cinchona calisaya TaxID=153742 RepID=A0ABD2ZNI8_9GENT